MNSWINCPTSSPEAPSRVVLFGGSSVATTYLSEKAKHHVLLQEMLDNAYSGQEIEVRNWADNGEFIARYLLRGTYENHRAGQAGIDVAIIRFGTNDQKRMPVEEYREQFRKFLRLLMADFPGVQVVFETGIYLDYPAHYRFDRNEVLNPYWQVSRDLAKELGVPLVDYFKAAKCERDQGNWDIRVRRGLIADASQDAGKEGDPEWFTDIHPNPEGVRIAVREEVRILQSAFPERLPSGQVAVERPMKTNAFYADYLKFEPERLVIRKSEDVLQGAP